MPSPAGDPSAAPDPSAWHRRPAGYGSKRCPICNAPTHCQGEHQLVQPETDTHKPMWFARRPETGHEIRYGGGIKPNSGLAGAPIEGTSYQDPGPLDEHEPGAYVFHYRPQGHAGKRCPTCDAPCECRGLHRARSAREGDGPRWLRVMGSLTPIDGTPPQELPYGWRSTAAGLAEADGDIVTSVPEVAAHFKVAASTIALWKRDGMPWVKVNDGYGGIYRLSEIKAWRDSRPERRQNHHWQEKVVDHGGSDPKHLAHLFHEHYWPKRLLGRSRSTLHQYTILFRHLTRFLGRPPELWDLTEDVAAGFMAWLMEKQGPVSVNKNMEKLVALWRYACRRGLVSNWPETMRVKEPKRIPVAWTDKQLLQLLAACAEEPGQIAGVPANRWWFCLCLLAYYCGVRVGSLMALKWQQVDLPGRSVLFLAETQKQFADQRFDLPDAMADALEQIREPARPLVFPWPRSQSLLWDGLTRILRRAGLPADRRSKFHRLRRTSASMLKAAGGNATDHLGHSSPAMTKRYIDPLVAGERSQTHLLPDLRPAAEKPLVLPTSPDIIDWL